MNIVTLWILALLQIIESESWCQLRMTADGDSNVTRVRYSPDRSLFATMTAGGSVTMWSTANMRPLGSLSISGTPSDIEFSPDSSKFVVAHSNTEIAFYDVKSPFS